jgi:DNA-binding response OmpR family regulator
MAKWLGAQDYIIKPFELQELMEKMKKILAVVAST